MLAAQGKDLGDVAVAMLLFGIGAALPLLVIGSLSRHTIRWLRGGLMETGSKAKQAIGLLLVLFGIFILCGADRTIEAVLVDASPAWLTAFSTQF